MKARTSRLVGAAMTAAVATTLAAPASAADPMDQIKHRKAVYEAIGGHMTAMVDIVKGKVPFAEDLPFHAGAMAGLSKIAGRVFPEGSDFGDTRAKMAIWENREDFNDKMRDFQAAAEQLDMLAEGGDMGAIAEQIGALGKTCKACHDDYRTEE